VRPLTELADLDWLALLGSAADLGDASFGELPKWRSRHRMTHVRESIALLNAARRSAEHDVATALEVLWAAKSPADIARGESAEWLVSERCELKSRPR
jgi:hypothetical protein